MTMTSRTCAFADRGDLERYVAGTSPASETEEFERHLVGCAICQDGVRLGSAVRAALRSPPSQLAPRPRRTRRRAALLAATLLAASIVAVVGVRVANQNAIRQLGAVASLPAYGGVAVRSEESEGDSLFAEGMRLYDARRFEEASLALENARARGADSVPTSFFLGVLRLVRDQPAAAQRELRVVLRHGDTPYAAEARFYLAKAWLRLGEGDSARAHLNELTSGPLPIAARARALVDSLPGAKR